MAGDVSNTTEYTEPLAVLQQGRHSKCWSRAPIHSHPGTGGSDDGLDHHLLVRRGNHSHTKCRCLPIWSWVIWGRLLGLDGRMVTHAHSLHALHVQSKRTSNATSYYYNSVVLCSGVDSVLCSGVDSVLGCFGFMRWSNSLNKEPQTSLFDGWKKSNRKGWPSAVLPFPAVKKVAMGYQSEKVAKWCHCLVYASASRPLLCYGSDPTASWSVKSSPLKKLALCN